jgi:hypothetical protein
MSLVVLLPAVAAEPFRLHPDNPHYFLFRDKATVLVTSGEHYGAVINADFDYVTYLDELQRNHLNNTRIWVGPYREIAGNFNISRNTLAPEPERFITPWVVTDGNRFDLSKGNRRYFDRLKDFMQQASKRGIVVEVNLFCPYYEDSMWAVSPLNARNNVNGVGDVPRTEVLTLKHPELVRFQEQMVRKLVSELSRFDNFYYEICNEPYFGGVTLDWQEHIANVIREAEKSGRKHLISQNIGNGSQRVAKPFDAVAIFNFHYSRPPESVAMNYDLVRAIGNNETGFDGTADATYRIQGWDFLMAGGGLYNNLDYSFVVGHERGDYEYPPTTPGGGSKALRAQLGVLHDFFDAMPFLRMTPAHDLIRGGVPEGASAGALGGAHGSYAVYVHHGRPVKGAKPQYQVDASEHRTVLELAVPAGTYEVEWTHPKTGAKVKSANAQPVGDVLKLDSPPYTEDIVVRIRRTTE